MRVVGDRTSAALKQEPWTALRAVGTQQETTVITHRNHRSIPPESIRIKDRDRKIIFSAPSPRHNLDIHSRSQERFGDHGRRSLTLAAQTCSRYGPASSASISVVTLRRLQTASDARWLHPRVGIDTVDRRSLLSQGRSVLMWVMNHVNPEYGSKHPLPYDVYEEHGYKTESPVRPMRGHDTTLMR